MLASQNTLNAAPVAMMRLDNALADAARLLADAGVEAPRREARLLAAHVMARGSTALLDGGALIGQAAFTDAVARRAAREPLAFITGRRGFWTLDLAVSPDTLVPRADSEALIEAAMAALPDRAGVHRILDLGTGTGCLLLAALSEFPHAFGVGVDVSPAAARLAGRNATDNRLDGRAAFVAGDWDTAIGGQFDLILCNPPYIETGAIGALMPEVGRHEPHRALDGGADGLEAYRRVVPVLAGLLSAQGAAVLELGAGQEAAVSDLAGQAGLTHLLTKADLGGVPRAIVFRHGIHP